MAVSENKCELLGFPTVCYVCGSREMEAGAPEDARVNLAQINAFDGYMIYAPVCSPCADGLNGRKTEAVEALTGRLCADSRCHLQTVSFEGA